jgi:hypothetical protein
MRDEGLIMAATRMKVGVAAPYRVLMAMGAAVLVLPVTSACGAGQAAQTSRDIVTN